MRKHLRHLVAMVLMAMALAGPAMAVDDNPPVKKSNTGICHARGTTYYAQTRHFTPYQTLEACLKSGGRLPNARHCESG